MLLAVIEDMVAGHLHRPQAARPGAARSGGAAAVLRHVGRRAASACHTEGDPGPRFITTEHWRLHRLLPRGAGARHPALHRPAAARDPRRDAGGLLAPPDPQYDAWLVNQLVIAVFHHYEYATVDEPPEQIADRLWRFCYGALGGPLAASSSAAAARKPRAVKAAK